MFLDSLIFSQCSISQVSKDNNFSYLVFHLSMCFFFVEKDYEKKLLIDKIKSLQAELNDAVKQKESREAMAVYSFVFV